MPHAFAPTIAHILHRLELAGAEVLAANLARHLSDRYNFVFLCLDDVGTLGQRLISEGFVVENLGRKPGLDLAVAVRLRRAVKRHRIALLHAHQYTPFTYAGLARLPRGTPPILFTEHGRHYPDRRRAKRLIANRLLLKPHDRVTAVGRFVKRALVDFEGIARRRIEVIYNGIDPDRFRNDHDQLRDAARQRLGIAPRTPLVLQIARFHPVKDHATALHAFTRALEEVPAAQLVLIGDGQERPAMQDLVRQLRIEDRVHFLGVREDVPDLLPAADVFLLSSLSEGISVTLLEAMAAELPIVATAVGGNGEVLEHGRTGLLSPRRDAVTLGHNLAALLQSAALRQRMGQAGRQRLLEHFTEQRMHDAYAAVYEQILSQNQSTAAEKSPVQPM